MARVRGHTHAAEVKAWNPSDQPDWLTEKAYREKIQPRLSGITVPTISSALNLSEPYAAEIRAGRQRPHPRHWQTLAQLVGVSPDVQGGPNGPVGEFRQN